MKKSWFVFGLVLILMASLLSSCTTEVASKPIDQPVDQPANVVVEAPVKPETPAGEMEIFPVYTADSDTVEPIPSFEAQIDKAAPIDMKVSEILKSLSLNVFKLPMTLVEIKESYGMKIAVVNLEEASATSDYKWNTGYFQGSTGGAMTVVSLTESLLQKAHEGEWIDGVTFWYEGKPIDAFEHVWTLMQTIYRTQHYKLADMAIGDAVGDHFVLKDFIDNKEERYTYFVLEGTYTMHAHLMYDFDYLDDLSITVIASPTSLLEIGLDDMYGELFKHTFTIIDISNTDALKAALTQEQLDRVMDGEIIEVELVLKDMETILYWESEYYNTVTFEALK